MNSNVAGTSIEIDNTVLEGIRSHVAGQYPAEACGVLLKQIGGSEVTTVRIRQFCMAENCSQGSDSLDSYRINPLRLFRMEQYWSELGFEVAGFYHSHPDRRAVPSYIDKTEWFEEQFLYSRHLYNQGRYVINNHYKEQRTL